MKRAVKVLSGVLAACLVGVSLAGCSAAKDEPTTQITTNESTEAPADEATEAPADEATEVPADTTAKKSITLGIDQLVTHQALDASCQGFIDGLKDAGYVEGENLTIDFNNADGDKGNAQTIAAKLVNSESDIILAIATDAAQACANATRDIPVFITAVTDPQSAGIVESNEVPGGNVTGTSDLTPVKRQMELLVKLLPNAKTVGVIYNSSEVNSEIQGNMAVAEAETLGLEATVATASQTSEIQSVVESLVGKVDAIYIPTDNMMASNMGTISMIATENKIPLICGEENMVKEGGLATYGINYYNLGKQTAGMAVKVLNGEAETATMPIEYLEDTSFYYNKEVADAIGIVIPDDLLAEVTAE